MKVQGIQTHKPFNSTGNSYQNSNHINFGYGYDYGDDDYLAANDYVHKSGNGNIFDYFKFLGLFCCALIQEGIEDYYGARRQSLNLNNGSDEEILGAVD